MGHVFLLFITGFLTIMAGVWLAMRHRDMIFRDQIAQIRENHVVMAMAREEASPPLDSIQTVVNELQIEENEIPEEEFASSTEFVSDDIEMENKTLEKEKFEEVMSVDGLIESLGEMTNIISESNIVCEEILVDERSGQVPKKSLQNVPATENNDETTETTEPSDVWKTWPSIETIEEMAGLAATFGEADSKEYQGIISQLQEIRHLFVESERCPVSENVQFVMKPHESKYVSMAFCRPTICKKKLQELS